MATVISNSGQASKPFLERIHLIKGDITNQKVNAIATVIPQNMSFCGTLNTAIQKAGGCDLDQFILENIYKPRPTEVYALPGFNLPSQNILLGIMPYFRTEFDQDGHHLAQCTRKIMELARCMLLPNIAIPPICCGKKGYPKARGARLIIQGISERLDENFNEIRIVCPDDEFYEIFAHKLSIIGWSPP